MFVVGVSRPVERGDRGGASAPVSSVGVPRGNGETSGEQATRPLRCPRGRDTTELGDRLRRAIDVGRPLGGRLQRPVQSIKAERGRHAVARGKQPYSSEIHWEWQDDG